MIKITATCRIHSISPVIQTQTGYVKRELVLDDSRVKDGQTLPNFIQVEFTGERMSLLDQFAPGHAVTVEAFLNGKEYNGRYFHNIKGLSIVPYQPQAQQYPQPAQQPYRQQPMQRSYQQPSQEGWKQT